MPQRNMVYLLVLVRQGRREEQHKAPDSTESLLNQSHHRIRQASLEYALPSRLIKSALELIRLDVMEYVSLFSRWTLFVTWTQSEIPACSILSPITPSLPAAQSWRCACSIFPHFSAPN